MSDLTEFLSYECQTWLNPYVQKSDCKFSHICLAVGFLRICFPFMFFRLDIKLKVGEGVSVKTSKRGSGY